MNQENNIDKKLSETIKDEIVTTSLDLGIDYSELVLDSNITDDVLSEVPIFKSIYAGTKIFGSIRSFYTARNIMTFLREFNQTKTDNSELTKFKAKLDHDLKYREKVIDIVIQYNDRFLQSIKSKIFANLFSNYLNKNIDWNKLLSMLQIVDTMNPILIELLHEVYKDYRNNKKIIDESHEGLLFACGIGYRHGNMFKITKLGKELYDFGLKSISTV